MIPDGSGMKSTEGDEGMKGMQSTENVNYMSTASLSMVPVTHGPSQSKNIKRQNSRNKQFRSFKLQAVLSNMEKS